jgi:hypothetical protein
MKQVLNLIKNEILIVQLLLLVLFLLYNKTKYRLYNELKVIYFNTNNLKFKYNV